MNRTKIAIFASGTGSNALNIIDHFNNHLQIEVAFVLSNKSDAPVLIECEKRNISTYTFNNSACEDGNFITKFCTEKKIEYIVLAGYLRLIPHELIVHYDKKIINIHPSLLPNYGGKGMYGMKVHQAVFDNKESFSGITIHYVNEEFDKGTKIAQFYCKVEKCNSAIEIQQKIALLEHNYFPIVLEKTILNELL